MEEIEFELGDTIAFISQHGYNKKGFIIFKNSWFYNKDCFTYRLIEYSGRRYQVDRGCGFESTMRTCRMVLFEKTHKCLRKRIII